ncbi:hypothetical protein [Glycomyces tenuis]|uniref:hypothetical protein n=1 Tax=Glycomyces tenuis TaxID=58116 RepID=UPI0004080DF6|nr:hypothetical protein [Glycomyces tenuis]
MDPVITAIATAAAGKLAGETAGGIVAAGKYVKDYFSRRAERKAILERAETRPDTAEVEDLAKAIAAVCADDTAFREQLTRLAGQPITLTQVNQAQQHVMFQNNFHGQGPGKVYQAETMNFRELPDHD